MAARTAALAAPSTARAVVRTTSTGGSASPNRPPTDAREAPGWTRTVILIDTASDDRSDTERSPQPDGDFVGEETTMRAERESIPRLDQQITECLAILVGDR